MRTADMIDISTDALEAFLTDTEARIGQARAAQMAVLAELDRRHRTAMGAGPSQNRCPGASTWRPKPLDV